MPRIKLFAKGTKVIAEEAVLAFLRKVKPGRIILKLAAPNSHSQILQRSLQCPVLTEFHLFPKFPTEIRLMIWAEAIEPRFVTIVENEQRFGLLALYPHPPLLYTSVESREVALQKYILTVGGPHERSPGYFSPEHDALLFNDYLDFYFFARGDYHGRPGLLDDLKSNVRHLAFPRDQDLWTSNISHLQDWTALKEIILVENRRTVTRTFSWNGRRPVMHKSMTQHSIPKDIVYVLRGSDSDSDFASSQYCSVLHPPVDPISFPEDSIGKFGLTPLNLILHPSLSLFRRYANQYIAQLPI